MKICSHSHFKELNQKSKVQRGHANTIYLREKRYVFVWFSLHLHHNYVYLRWWKKPRSQLSL